MVDMTELQMDEWTKSWTPYIPYTKVKRRRDNNWYHQQYLEVKNLFSAAA